jgi:hypothetical protein
MKKAKRYLIIVGIGVLVIVVAGLALAGIFDKLVDVLYIFLIILATFSIISTAALIYLLYTLIKTIMLVRDEMKPLVGTVQETVHSVRGSMEETLDLVKDTAKSAGQTASVIGSTAHLTSEFGIAPGVRALSVVLASRQIARVFMGKGRTRRRYEERRKKQMELLKSAAEGE